MEREGKTPKKNKSLCKYSLSDYDYFKAHALNLFFFYFFSLFTKFVCYSMFLCLFSLSFSYTFPLHSPKNLSDKIVKIIT